MSLLEELKIIYLNMYKVEEAIQCAHEKTERLSRLYEEGHWYLLNHYKNMARFYMTIAQFDRALELTELRLSQLTKVSSAPQISRN